MRIQRSTLVAVLALTTLLTGCGGAIPTRPARVDVQSETAAMPTTDDTTMTPIERAAAVRDVRRMRVRNTARLQAVKNALAQLEREDDIARWTLAAIVNANAEAADHRATTGTRLLINQPPRPSAPIQFGNLADVVACIKRYESGDYNEHSHINDGSGAYQYIPGTWRAWSARAGHGGYAYAYQAPPEVQDAVLLYTLTHGGAGNWSNRFGSDPCTASLPGGG